MLILKVLGFIVLGITLFVLVTYVFMRVWNWLVPSTFNGPRLRFVQALGLLFLSRVLFGGFGHGGGHWRGSYDGKWRHGHYRFFDRSEQPGKPRQEASPVQPDKAAPNE